MLREGCDVRNVRVIVPLRAYNREGADPARADTRPRYAPYERTPAPGRNEQVVVNWSTKPFRQLWDQRPSMLRG